MSYSLTLMEKAVLEEALEAYKPGSFQDDNFIAKVQVKNELLRILKNNNLRKEPNAELARPNTSG